MLYNQGERNILMIESLNDSKFLVTKNHLIKCTNPTFEQELSNILKKCGDESVFVGLYKQRLQYLADNHNTFFLRGQWFEKLKYDPKHRLFSMKFKSDSITKNIRIIFICTNTQIILLCAFIENDKKSYDRNIELANKKVEKLIKLKFIERDDIICHT